MQIWQSKVKQSIYDSEGILIKVITYDKISIIDKKDYGYDVEDIYISNKDENLLKKGKLIGFNEYFAGTEGYSGGLAIKSKDEKLVFFGSLSDNATVQEGSIIDMLNNEIYL